MLFWIVAALLTLGASLVVLVPLAGRSSRAASAGSHELEVYKDQLAELDRDSERGLIGATEAAEARAEIGRRILRLAGSENAEQGPSRLPRLARVVAVAAVLAVPLVSWGFYAGLGSPDLPGQPLSARFSEDPANDSMEQLLARAEAHLIANPNDARGWTVIAPVYMRLTRYDDAARAYRAIINLDGATAQLQASLGEALVYAAGGMVTQAASQAFTAAIALDPKDARARYYLATASSQQGDFAAAATGFETLLADLPADATARPTVQASLAEARRMAAGPTAAPAPAPGPGQAEMDAAAEMSPEDRSAMIGTMVARLDEKLRANPNDREGWQRLVRSYVVLGDGQKARDALERGVKALETAGVADQAKQLADFATSLGLPAAN